MSAREYPKKIFIESSLLFQLGPRLENVKFAKLLETGRSVNCELLVSEVSWQEYLRERKREFRKHVESSLAIQKTLERHGKSIPEHDEALEKINAYLKDMDAHYRVRATERGIPIVPLPSIDISRLLKISIECIPPFEDPESKSREKGFRDALIMFSVLEALRGRPEDNALVITNDKLLAEGFDHHAEEFRTRVQIANTFEEASAMIDQAVTEAERSRLRREMEESIEMLMRYRDDLEALVQTIEELSDSDLGQGLSSLLFPASGQSFVDIRGVKSVSFDRISSAVWMEKDKEQSRILFACRCNANVVVNAPYLRPLLEQSRQHKIGHVREGHGVSIAYLGRVVSQEPTEEKTLPFQMYGDARLIREGRDWRLQGLRLDKSLPLEDESRVLWEALENAFGPAGPD